METFTSTETIASTSLFQYESSETSLFPYISCSLLVFLCKIQNKSLNNFLQDRKLNLTLGSSTFVRSSLQYHLFFVTPVSIYIWLACLIHNLRIHGSSPANCKIKNLMNRAIYWWVLIGRNTVSMYIFIYICNLLVFSVCQND